MHCSLRAPFAPLCLATLAFAQDENQAPAPLDRAALEAAFSAKLTGAKLVGRFTADDAPEGRLGTDSYTLGEVRKLENGKWLFQTLIEYGEKSLKVPLVIDIEWAGDTPVITLTDFAVPMMGKFTARVLFYGDQYAGVWSGGGTHRGEMYGKILTAAELQEAGDEHGERGGGDGGDDGDDGGAGGDGKGGPRLAGLDPAPPPAPTEEKDSAAKEWPSFRGYRARGVADGFQTVASFDVDSGENVLWKADIPGLAHSSPIVWGDRIYLTSAVRLEGGNPEVKVGLYGDIAPVEDEGPQAFIVLCLDKESGEILWERAAWEGVPKYKRHPKGSFAAPTPATDGERLVAFYGTEGLYCYDVEGELQWKKDFGDLDAGFFMVPSAQWGFSSSPVIHDGRVIVLCDVQGQSFLAVLDLATGEEVWRTLREEVPTFGTPTVDVREGRSQIVCNGWKHTGGYDLATGKELWKVTKGGDIPTPTPVVAHDLIYITSAHGQLAPLYAVQYDAEGELDLEHEEVAWGTPRKHGCYMSTLLVYGDELYGLKREGILQCFDARTGAEHYRERVSSGPNGFSASPIAADGKVYVTSEYGQVYAVRAGKTFEILGESELVDVAMASPAVSEGVIFWRTQSFLVAVGKKKAG